MSYKHFTKEDRETLHRLKVQKYSNEYIAKILGKHPASISRELKRNSCEITNEYWTHLAINKAKERRSIANKTNKHIPLSSINYIKEKLSIEWSPDQIVGRMKLDNIPLISHETIYRMIYENRFGLAQYSIFLRRKQKKRQNRIHRKKRRQIIQNRVGIEHREETKNFGHWELDTVIGKNHKGAILTSVEKKSKYLKAELIEQKSAANVERSISNMFKSLPEEGIRTMTSDNGTEFTCHQEVVKKLKTLWYFANPYHSWERGLNEHTNGLLRQYYPKKTDFKAISKEELQQVVEKINNRPRKVLAYRTPNEVFSEELKLIKQEQITNTESLPIAL